MDSTLPLDDNSQNNIDPNVGTTPTNQDDSTPINSTGSSLGVNSITGFESAVPVEAPLPEESAPKVEVVIPQVEKLSTPEVPVAPAIAESGSEPKAVIPPVIPGSSDENLNVVDKRTNHEQLTSIANSADQLTTVADEEEEDFIKHVEEVHTINN